MKRPNPVVAAALFGAMLVTPTTSTVAAPPLPAVRIPSRIAADEKSDLAELKTKVESVDKTLKGLQDDIKQLADLLKGKKDKDGIPLPSDPGLVADLKKLKDSLAAVETEINKMKTQSSSLRPPLNSGSSTDPKPVAVKGTVRVVNEYPVQISIIVNGTSYRVQPSKSLDVDVPVGEFTYQLLESGGASTKSFIKEKELVTLRIK